MFIFVHIRQIALKTQGKVVHKTLTHSHSLPYIHVMFFQLIIGSTGSPSSHPFFRPQGLKFTMATRQLPWMPLAFAIMPPEICTICGHKWPALFLKSAAVPSVLILRNRR